MLRLLTMFIFLNPAYLKGIIVESSKFAELERHIVSDNSKKALIICDIDNTLLKATQQLGSVAWGDYKIAELINKGISKEDAEEIESILWKTVQPHVKVQSVDPETPIILEEIQNKGFSVLGLTARCPQEADYTIEQLSSIGIYLGKSNLQLNFESCIKEEKKPCYTQGILFCTPFQKKSYALFQFLDANKINPESIIFVDDKLSHLEDLSRACIARGISFTGIRFSGADDDVRTFNHEISDIQWILFPTLISDNQAEEILHFNKIKKSIN